MLLFDVSVEITADCIKCTALIKQLGSNFCYVDETPLVKGQTVTVKQNKVIYLLKGEYPHRITFNIKNEVGSSSDAIGLVNANSESKKRSRGDDDDDKVRKRMRNDISDDDDDDDDDEVRAIEEKLKKMRESVQLESLKDVSKPELAHTEVKSVSGERVPNERGKPLDKAEWIEKDTLMVHHSKNLSSSAKVDIKYFV